MVVFLSDFIVQEGLFLMRNNVSPYEGDTFHETPLSLVAADFLSKLPACYLFLVFVLCDLLTAIILAFVVQEAV